MSTDEHHLTARQKEVAMEYSRLHWYL